MKNHTNSSGIFYPLLITFIGVVVLMTVYESAKQIAFSGITIWQSHIVTILFSAAAATAVTAVILMKNRVSMLIYNISSDAIMVTDHRNRIIDVNPAFTKVTGYTLKEIKGRSPSILKSSKQSDEFFRQLWKDLMSHDVWRGELWNRRKNGELYALSASIYVLRHPNGRVFRHVAQFADVTEQKMREEALRASEARARGLSESLKSTFNELYSIVEANPDLLYVINADGELIKWNTQLEKFCGLTHDQMLRRPATDFIHKDDRRAIQQGVTDVFKNGYATFEVRFIRHDGAAVPYWCNGVVLKGPSGEMIGFTGTGRDVTERRMNEEKMLHAATHDTLTGLPNKELFSDRLQQALASDKRDKSRLAVMFIDTDQFKPVNDKLGHDVGDALLKQTAKRITDCLREADTAARVGGDEFLVLLPAIDEAADAVVVATKMCSTLGQTYQIDGHVIRAPVSIGIAVYPEDGVEGCALIKNADTAMYYVKESGGNAAMLFRRKPHV